MMRWDIINRLIQKNNYKSYLEIGYFMGWSFDNVKCSIKTAVDPDPRKTAAQQDMKYGMVDYDWSSDIPEGGQGYYEHRLFKLTSDDYFKSADRNRKWDLIFIDGLHEAEQVTRDIENSLKHLSPGGTIVLHDMNPPSLQHVTTGDAAGNWNGDAYKAFARFRYLHPHYESYTVDTDWGCGVIHTPARPNVGAVQGAFLVDDWEYFDKNRADILGLISPQEFLDIIEQTPAGELSCWRLLRHPSTEVIYTE